MKKIIPAILTAIMSLSGFGQTIDNLKALFDYDKGDDLNFRVIFSKDTTQATINYVSFSSVNGLKVTASLLIPKQKLREFPVVIFLNDGSENGESFLPQALDLATNAFASLIIDPLPRRPEPFRLSYHNFNEPRKDFGAYRQAVLDIRRSIDALEQHPQIDRNRIAFIGNGDGAMTGAIVSGIEQRILIYILMSCNSCYSCILQSSNDPFISKIRSNLTSEQITQYEQMIKPLNPSNYLPYHRASLIFYQFAQNDPYFEETTAKATIQATKEPESFKFYKTTGPGLLIFQEATTDQINWLKDHL
jgi:hypothetical protein